MKNVKIRVKMLASFAVAIIAAFLIGMCGFLNIARMNNIISGNDVVIVRPLVYLNRITFDIGQTELLVRDAIIAGGENQDDVYGAIQDHQEDIRKQINNYLAGLYDNGYEDTPEYAGISGLSVRVSEWSTEIDNVARLSANGQTAAALSRLHDAALPKSAEVNALLNRLVEINEREAFDSRQSAYNSYILSVVLIGGLFVLVAVSLVVFGRAITGSISRSVGSIIAAAEALADGDTGISADGLPDDEMGQIGRALARVADSIADAIADNYAVLSDAGAGYLDARADVSKYKGDYLKILQSVNMTLQTFCRHLDIVPAGISFFDPSGAFIYGNKAMIGYLSYFDLQRGDGWMLSSILAASGSEAIRKKAAALFNNGRGEAFSEIFTTDKEGGGKPYAFTVSLHPVYGEQTGSRCLTCVMLTMVDITDVTRAKSDAERANRAKTEFLPRDTHLL